MHRRGMQSHDARQDEGLESAGVPSYPLVAILQTFDPANPEFSASMPHASLKQRVSDGYLARFRCCCDYMCA